MFFKFDYYFFRVSGISLVHLTFFFFFSDHDERVVPLHSFKFAAQLQHQLPHNPNPLLLRVAIQAGHGGSATSADRILAALDKSKSSRGLTGKERFFFFFEG